MSTNKRRSSLTFGEGLLFLAGGLFCLVLITTAMMGSLLARYTSTGEAQDTARVAKWDVSALFSGDDPVSVVCRKKDGGDGFETDGAFTLTVTSDSEVALRYGIVITFGSPLPQGISAQLKNGQTVLTPEKTDKVWTYENAGTLPAGSQSAQYDLIFTANWADIGFTQNDTDGKTDEETFDLAFTVTVTAEQVD